MSASLIDRAKRTGFHKGDKAPFAYNEVFTYPKDFQPWAPNYKGNGLFYGMLAGAFFGKRNLNTTYNLAYFMYEDTYLKRTGRTRRPDREYYKP